MGCELAVCIESCPRVIYLHQESPRSTADHGSDAVSEQDISKQRERVSVDRTSQNPIGSGADAACLSDRSRLQQLPDSAFKEEQDVSNRFTIGEDNDN